MRLPAHVTALQAATAPQDFWITVHSQRATQLVPSLRRTPYWCIADESYFGTLLSSKLEGMLEGGLTDDIAMAMLRGGDGIYAQDIDLELVGNLTDSNMRFSVETPECCAAWPCSN